MSGAPGLQVSPPPEAVLQAALADLKAGRAPEAHRRLAPLAPEHAMRPRAGRLTLFPSYLWRGVTPFGGEAERLAMAFNLTPGRPARAR